MDGGAATRGDTALAGGFKAGDAGRLDLIVTTGKAVGRSDVVDGGVQALVVVVGDKPCDGFLEKLCLKDIYYIYAPISFVKRCV